MTIFVDDMRRKARVGRVNGIWCHLLSDSLDPTELHKFAHVLGLKRSWFQHDPKFPHRDHYDVTERMRKLAVTLGAVEISYPGELAEILSAKRS